MVLWDIGVDKPIAPNEPLPPMPAIPAGDILIIGGRAPTWRFGMALHEAHGSPAGAVAFFDPRLGGGVVVASHRPGIKDGDVLPCEWQD